MKLNKLLGLTDFGLFMLLMCAFNFNVHAQNSTCETAIEANYGDNVAPDTPNWYTFYIDDEIETLELSTQGMTASDTYLEVYSSCSTNRIAFNDDSNGNNQSFLSMDVSNYRGQTLLIHWKLWSGTGGNFDWTLRTFDAEGNEGINRVSIEDFSIWYGEKLKIENANNTFFPIQYSIVGNDIGVISIDGDSVEALAVAGSQEVIGVIYNNEQEILDQKTFTITTQVDPSGLKKGLIYGLENSYLFKEGESYTFTGYTNSDAEVSYTITSGSEYVSLVDNVLTINEDVFDKEIIIEASIAATAEFSAETFTITVSIPNYINSIPSQQYFALLAFYESFNGDGWKSNTNWLSNEPIDTWTGISTETRTDDSGIEYESVTEIYFNNNNLQGEFPSEIGNLSDLESITIRYVSMESIPEEIGNLSHLTELILSRNSLISLPNTIGNLSALVKLDVNDNNITSLPSSIGNLSNLEHLNVSYNDVASLPSEISNLSNLSYLNLSSNNLEILPNTIGNLSSLETLIIEINKINSLPVSIGNLLNLEHLNISRNELTSLPYEIGNLTNLEDLYLSNNSIPELPATISNATSLRELFMSWNGLSEIPSQVFTLSSLVKFRFRNNNLTSIPSELSQLQNLEYLDLSYNQISELSNSIGDLLSLRSLYVHYNNLSDLPSTLSNCTQLEIFYMENNNFSSFPSVLATFANSDLRLYVDDNYLSFDDLIGFAPILESIYYFDYSPQNKFELVVSQSVEDKTTTLINTELSEGNVYQWYEDDELIEGETSSTLTFSFEDKLDKRFRCSITNDSWPDLTLWSQYYLERGELITLVVQNIPETTPEGEDIFAVGNMNDYDYFDRNYKLVYNEAGTNYEMIVPKNLDTLNFHFALRNFDIYSELNAEEEFFDRTIELSNVSGNVIIDDILAWNRIPVPANSCDESIEVDIETKYYVDEKQTWYKYTADEDMELKIFLDNPRSSVVGHFYSSCSEETLIKKETTYWSSFESLVLREGEVVYFSLSHTNNQKYSFSFELEKTPIKYYTVASIPENTPQNSSIYAIGTFNDFEEISIRYPLAVNEKTGLYEVFFQKELEVVDFYFVLNNSSRFFEVGAQGDTISRTIDVMDNETVLDPIVAWSDIPNIENDCSTPIEITESGNHIKGIGSQWYTYTAETDVKIFIETPYYSGRHTEVSILDECEGRVIHYEVEYDDNLDFHFIVKEGETILLNLETYTSLDFSYEWSIDIKPVKTFYIDNIPSNTPEGWNIYANGTMNNFDLSNWDYPLTYNEDLLLYEISLPIEEDTTVFNFMLRNVYGLKEADQEGAVVTRKMDLSTFPSNILIDDIYAWQNELVESNTCDNAYELTQNGTLVVTSNPVWYTYTASDSLESITLSTIGLTSIDTEVSVYSNCNGDRIYYNDDVDDDNRQTLLEFRLQPNETIYIEWDNWRGNRPFTWAFTATNVTHQTVENFVGAMTEYGRYNLSDSVFSSDQGIAFDDVSVISGGAEIVNGILRFKSLGEVELQVSNLGNTNHYSLDETVTININNYPTSIEDELSQAIRLYPNPASKLVTINIPTIKGEIELSLISTTGQLLETWKTQGNSREELDISNLQTGMYILRINTSQGVGIKRLIVK